ncbi:MAG: hypothetical protein J0I11_11155 [Actinobacteria bacterium]|nr:hypothetical protein [Actinomycetota bacterium]
MTSNLGRSRRPAWNLHNERRHSASLDRAGTAVLAGSELAPSNQAARIHGDD